MVTAIEGYSEVLKAVVPSDGILMSSPVFKGESDSFFRIELLFVDVVDPPMFNFGSQYLELGETHFGKDLDDIVGREDLMAFDVSNLSIALREFSRMVKECSEDL